MGCDEVTAIQKFTREIDEIHQELQHLRPMLIFGKEDSGFETFIRLLTILLIAPLSSASTINTVKTKIIHGEASAEGNFNGFMGSKALVPYLDGIDRLVHRSQKRRDPNDFILVNA